MSVCICPGYCDTIGCMIRGPHIARSIPQTKRGAGDICAVCGNPVAIGEPCYDFAGVRESCDLSGWFYRMHAECFELMELFSEKLCGGEWAVPFDITEAAEHAVSQGDDPYWRDWLFKYERIWRFGPAHPIEELRELLWPYREVS